MPIQRQPHVMRCAATDTDGSRTDCGPKPAQAHGFTLIELLIVLAIIAILAAIAYPSYTKFILKGKRAEGRAALVNLLQQEEAYIAQNGTYKLFAAGASGTPFRTYSNDDTTSTSAAYTLGAQNCPAPASQAAAPNDCVQVFTAANNISDPVISQLNITSNGTKSCTATDTTLCWP